MTGVQTCALPIYQRIADVPKTIVSQSLYKYWLKQDLDIDVKRVAAMAGVSYEDIADLPELQAYYRVPGAPAELIKIPIPAKLRRKK